MYIKSVDIKNYKCFEEQSVEFSIPNGKKGSGLNILIGENGCGKTTILEAINFIDQSKFLIENNLSVNNFHEIDKEIQLNLNTQRFKCNLDFPYKGNFECDGISFLIKHRERKAPGKVLSSPFVIKSEVRNITDNYLNDNGNDSGKEIPSLNLIYGNSSIEDNGLNIFYFDNSRSRHIRISKYKTTFQRIIEDLNWRFIKALQNKVDEETGENLYSLITKELQESFLTQIDSIAQKGVGSKISKQMKTFLDNDKLEQLVIDVLNFLEPFNNAFFALRDKSSIHQIKLSDTGSGIEIILSLLLLKNISGQSKGDIVYLIDEPELHLHPKAQTKLVALLLEESKDKQIIIATHSPYLLKTAIAEENTGVNLFTKSNGSEIEVTNARNKNWGIFPWSPSWGEVNYFAYDMSTIEFHNELYGFLEEKFKTKLNSLAKNRSWQNKKTGKNESVSLSTYIRHSIHHPENKINKKFTEKELKASIESMIKLI